MPCSILLGKLNSRKKWPSKGKKRIPVNGFLYLKKLALNLLEKVN
jgi:hypothetical protein